MPDLEISNLPALAEAGVAATDPLAIADISASETKKVTVKDLIEAGVALIDNTSIPGSKIGTLSTDQVATGAIQDDAVTNAKIEHPSISLGGLTLVLGSTDATPALDLTDATNYPASSLTGTITNTQLAGSIANSKLTNSSVSFGGVSLALGGTDATPAFDLQDATGYKTTSLVGTITNAQLAGSIANSKLVASSVSLGGVSVALGGTDATPAFNLTDATNYPTSALVGTITNAQLAGSIANAKLVNSSVSLGGVSIALGGTDATPAFDLADATGYLTSSLVGTITNAQLAGSIDVSKLSSSTDISLGGVSIALGSTDATPAFNLSDATHYPTSALVGTITNAQLAGSIANSKLANSSVSLGGITVALGASDATPAFDLTDATGYKTTNLVGTITNAQLAGSITAAKLVGGITNAQLAGSIANNKLANSSVNFGGVSVALGASDATPAFDLADATNYPASSLTGTITNAQLAGSIDVSKLTSSSASIGGVTITLGTTDATPAFDLQDATGYPTSALVGTITNAQLAGSIAATKLVSGSITSTQLGTNSVTDTELANNAVDTGAVQNGAITNDKVETSTSATTGLDGATKLRDGTVTPAKLNTSNLDRSLNVASGNLGINNAVTGGAATRSGISYNAEGLITGTAALVAGDLPVSTATAVGGVSIPTAGGLTITGTGAVSIAATTTAATATKVTYNTFGQIISSAALAATDLPIGTANTVGALSVPTGGPLSVDSNGALTVSNSGVSAGTGTKVTVDAKGRVTTLANLSDSDLPNHSAALLTSGSIAAARISNDSIDGSKLSDSSTTIFQSIAQQGYPTAQFNGQLLFDTVSEDAFIWDGTAWQAITTLTKGSLVFGGTFNANTSQMVSTTSAGIAAGLSVGSNLPTPSETVDGVYVVVSTGGTPTSPAPVVALAPPDYILGVTNTSGSSWNEVDLSQTVAGQVASNITFTPYGQLSSTNVQDALQELETEKMSFAGGTITGQVLIGNTGSLVFEGSSVDDYEITLAVADPTTSDKTITLPDVTGTVITSGDTGTVTSTMIADGTIVNADINASAAIALTKLQGIASAKIIVGDSSGVATEVAVTGDIAITNTGVTSITAGSIVNADISGSAAITGSKVTTGTTSAVGVLQLTDGTTSTSTTTAATPAGVKAAKDAADAAQATADAALPKAGGTMTDNLIIDNGKELRLSESDGDGTNYTGLKAQAQTGDITLTLPAVAPTAGQVLKADASTPTTLTWATDAATDSTKMPLAGGTFTGDVTFTGDASDGLWDKSASAFVANLTGNVTGNTSGSSGSCTGNAATATALAASVNIGGVAFDGTASINLPGVNAAGNQSTTGNAATATKFASSVNIGGVAFDGSASINLPGVNASGTQDTSGTAALATSFTVTANNSTDETVYPLFADGATGSQGAETDTGLTYNPSTGLLTSTGFSGSGASLTALNASNLSSGTVAAARLGSGSSVTTKFLRGDNTWQTISATPEGTAILSTGESGGTKFLREDGDGTCSWQSVAAGGTTWNGTTYNLYTATAGNSNAGTYNIALGKDAGNGFSANASDLIAIGTEAGYTAPDWRTGLIYIGNEAGKYSTGDKVTYIGHQCGLGVSGSSTGYQNTGLGWQALKSHTSGYYNTALGANALNDLTTGQYNVAVGDGAGGNVTTGGYNTLIGAYPASNLTTGSNNTVIGKGAQTSSATVSNEITLGDTNITKFRIPGINFELADNGGTPANGTVLTMASGGATWAAAASGVSSDAQYNTYGGTDAGNSSSTSDEKNVCFGYEAGKGITGDENVFIGYKTGTSGASSVCVGFQAGPTNYANSVTAVGWQAGKNINGANSPTCVGAYSGYNITTGSSNTALGAGAMTNWSGVACTGEYNTGIGSGALHKCTSGNRNIAIGAERAGYELTTGSYNILIGDYAGFYDSNHLTTGDNNILIGRQVAASSATISNEITLGNTSITKFRIPGINFTLKDNGGTPTTGQVLTADSSGEGYWSAVNISSDARFNTVGGTDAGALVGGVGSTQNTLFGYKAGQSIASSNFSGGQGNTGFGYKNFEVATTAENNTAIGNGNMGDLTTGWFNFAAGVGNLSYLTTGRDNYAIGYGTLGSVTTGEKNVAIGTNAASGTTGSSNTMVGYWAGNTVYGGSNNTLLGNQAAPSSTSVSNEITLGNTSVTKFRIPGIDFVLKDNGGTPSSGQVLTADSNGEGYWAAAAAGVSSDAQKNTVAGTNAGSSFSGTSAIQNNLFGYDAGSSIDSGDKNCAFGDYALNTLSTGTGNTALGSEAGYWMTTPDDNTLVGRQAGVKITNSSQTTLIGAFAGADLQGYSHNHTCVGYKAGEGMNTAFKHNNMCLGYFSGTSTSPSGVITSDNVICLGNNSVTDLYCADTSISSSDSRDKTDITNFTHGLDWVNKLNPITYRWDKRTWYNEYNEDGTIKNEVTPDGSKKKPRQHIGFLAQDVLAIEQADGFASKKDDMLVVNLNEDDTAYGLKYERLVPVLVNAIKELSAKVETLEAKLA